MGKSLNALVNSLFNSLFFAPIAAAVTGAFLDPGRTELAVIDYIVLGALFTIGGTFAQYPFYGYHYKKKEKERRKY